MASADSPSNSRPLPVLRSPGAPALGDRQPVLHELDAGRLPDHMQQLYRAALLLAGSREDAEDLVQETYVRVLRRPRLLRRGGELPYLLRALRNTWLDTLRTPQVETADAADVEALRVEAGGSDPLLSLEARALLAAVYQLPPVYRETLVAVDVLGLSYKEAARALDTSEGTVMSRLFRARSRVARTLGEEPPQDQRTLR